MRIAMSTRVILAVGVVPIAWTGLVWLSDLLTLGYIWDENEVWGMVIGGYVAAPILLVGLGKLAFDNRPRRRSN
jgi:hypothetical protein